MAKKGEVKIKILGDASHLDRVLGATRSKLSSFGGALRTAGVVAAKGIGIMGAAAGAFGAKAVMLGSDLEETLSKVRVVFGEAAGRVTAFADDMAEKFGLPKRVMMDAAAGIGLVGKASGLTQKDAAGLGTQLAGLAADASSFYNVPLEEALLAIQSGLVGEAEPMRRFGVLLNEAAVKAEAVALGIAKEGEELSEAQKVQARSSLIIKGMNDASGDLERTSGSLANRIRELKGRAENFAASLGQKLLPVVLGAMDLMEKWVPIVREKLAGALAGLSAWWDANGPRIQAVAQRLFQALAGWVEDVVPPIRAWVQDVLGELSAWWAKWGPRIGALAEKIAEVLADLGEKGVRAAQAIHRNWDKIYPVLKVLGALITAVLIPHWIRLGVQALAASAKNVQAWVTGKAQASSSAASQVASSYRVIGAWVAQGAAAVRSGAQTVAIWAMYKAEALRGAAAHAASALRVVAGWVMMGVSALAAAAQIAIAWLISMGPIALVVAAVVALVVLIVKNFDTIKAAIAAAWNWVKETSAAVWHAIQNAVRAAVDAVVGFVVGIKNRVMGAALTAYDGLRDGIESVKTFVKERIDGLVGFVTGMPGRIRSAASGMWDGITSAFKGAINAIIRAWNRLEFKIPGFKVGPIGYDGFTLGMPDIPLLARGGVVDRPTLAVLGDGTGANRTEIATPERLLRSIVREESGGGGGGATVHVEHFHAGDRATPDEIARSFAWLVRTGGVTNGRG